jgi:hypothetical protein
MSPDRSGGRGRLRATEGKRHPSASKRAALRADRTSTSRLTRREKRSSTLASWGSLPGADGDDGSRAQSASRLELALDQVGPRPNVNGRLLVDACSIPDKPGRHRLRQAAAVHRIRRAKPHSYAEINEPADLTGRSATLEPSRLPREMIISRTSGDLTQCRRLSFASRRGLLRRRLST